jgi:hypothetical protein
MEYNKKIDNILNENISNELKIQSLNSIINNLKLDNNKNELIESLQNDKRNIEDELNK